MVGERLGVGNLEGRKSSWHVADQGDAASGEVEQPGCDKPADDQDEGSRDRGCDGSQPEHHQGGGTHDHRRQLGLAESPDPRAELTQCVRPSHFGAGELRQLTDDHVDRRTEQEPRDHRPRQELSNPLHPQHRQHEKEDTYGEGHQGDERRDIISPCDAGDGNRAGRDGRQS
jgi:hypothetical protein